MRASALVVSVLIGISVLSSCGSDNKQSSNSTSSSAKQSGSSSSTPSGQQARLKVRVSPAKAGAPAKVSYAVTISTRTGAKPAAAKQITFRAQRGFKLNAAAFPSCTLADLKGRRLSACAKAKVGTGIAEVISPKGKTLRSRLSSFNGGRAGSKTTLLYNVQTPGYSPISVAASVSTLSAGKWGYSISYPPISGALPIAKLTLGTNDATVTRGGKKIHLIQTPASCAKSWKFDSNIVFRSGEKLKVSSTAPCSS